MAKRSELQTRQSKSSTQDGLDSEDKNIYDLQNDIDMQIHNIKIEVLDKEYLDEQEPIADSPLKFSIKVEVEEFDERSHNIKLENDRYADFVVDQSIPHKNRSSVPDYAPEDLSVVDTRINDISLSNNTSLHIYEGDETDLCLEADEIARTSNNIIDKILAMEVKNFCGVLAKPKQDVTVLDRQMYTVYENWKDWCVSSNSCEQPLFYKCYVCEKSWWHLGPFIEHAKKHASEVYTISLEISKSFLCNIALTNKVQEPERYVYTEGDCWRCNKPYCYHAKTDNICYKCKGCQKYFFKCMELYVHENVCLETPQRKKNIVCRICEHKFETPKELERHLYINHTVRSDQLMLSTYTKCTYCNKKRCLINNQKCPKRYHKFKCKHCFRKYTNQYFLDSHKLCTRSSIRCVVCSVLLPLQCMEIEHYMTHTDLFKLVNKCSLCTDVFFFWEEDSMKYHQSIWHKNNKDYTIYFEMVLVPAKCLEKLKTADPEPIAFFAAVNDEGTDMETTVNTYDDDVINVHDIKEEVIENEYNDDDVNRYVIEEDTTTYDEFMTNILESGKGNVQIKTEIEDVDEDISDRDMTNQSRDTDDGEEPRLIIDMGEHEDTRRAKRTRTRRNTAKRDPKIYSCCRCGFQGIHRDYKEHVLSECLSTRKRRLSYDEQPKINKSHKCSHCKVTFISLHGYVGHFATTHGYKEHCCPVCLQGFDEEKVLFAPHFLSHVKQMFLKVKAIDSETASSSMCKFRNQCRECNKYVENANLFSHWESHFKVKQVEEKCYVKRISTDPKTTLSDVDVNALIEKLMVVRSNYTQRNCTICDRHFDRINDSKRHLIEHLLADAYKNMAVYGFLRCQICKTKHAKPDDYKKHLREHGSLPIYKCGLCNKSFSDSSNFVKHKKTHNIQVLVCDICKSKYQAKASLEKHMELHNTTKPMPCKLCSKIFTLESAYKKHMRMVHEKNRAKFRCVMCDLKFYSLKNKWDHMWQVHKQRKMIADCPACGKSFRKYQDVRSHIRNEHKSVEMTYLRLYKQGNDDMKRHLKKDYRLQLDAKETLVVYE